MAGQTFLEGVMNILKPADFFDLTEKFYIGKDGQVELVRMFRTCESEQVDKKWKKGLTESDTA